MPRVAYCRPAWLSALQALRSTGLSTEDLRRFYRQKFAALPIPFQSAGKRSVAETMMEKGLFDGESAEAVAIIAVLCSRHSTTK